jgi:hypothetical protein
MPKYDVKNPAACKAHALWSNHAIMRLAEYKISCDDLYYAWVNAVESELSEEQKQYKFSKFGTRSLNDRYYWDHNTDLLFTINVSGSGQWFIETVTLGRGNKKD